ncbi:hypothetical protein BpHYR1_004861 [Brachionus plicatilis]|uniref:Uncharacterized protein n=1 Tax=Brachionus plicatilis TaxID=10195 RepID=A0A3M7SY27_BRAPC|nr:hypothetical protein BpHYR1_004861 [Brachionus plicatilis]
MPSFGCFLSIVKFHAKLPIQKEKNLAILRNLHRFSKFTDFPTVSLDRQNLTFFRHYDILNFDHLIMIMNFKLPVTMRFTGRKITTDPREKAEFPEHWFV